MAPCLLTTWVHKPPARERSIHLHSYTNIPCKTNGIITTTIEEWAISSPCYQLSGSLSGSCYPKFIQWRILSLQSNNAQNFAVYEKSLSSFHCLRLQSADVHNGVVTTALFVGNVVFGKSDRRDAVSFRNGEDICIGIIQFIFAYYHEQTPQSNRLVLIRVLDQMMLLTQL